MSSSGNASNNGAFVVFLYVGECESIFTRIGGFVCPLGSFLVSVVGTVASSSSGNTNVANTIRASRLPDIVNVTRHDTLGASVPGNCSVTGISPSSTKANIPSQWAISGMSEE